MLAHGLHAALHAFTFRTGATICLGSCIVSINKGCLLSTYMFVYGAVNNNNNIYAFQLM